MALIDMKAHRFFTPASAAALAVWAWPVEATAEGELAAAEAAAADVSAAETASSAPSAADIEGATVNGDVGASATAFTPARVRKGPARKDGQLGFDLRLGLSNGMLGAPGNVGLDLVYSPWAPIFLFAGVDTNGATVAGHVDAQVNLLTFFQRSPWTPFIRAGYTQFWFTDVADQILDATAPELRDDLAEAGTDLRFAGVHMHLVQVGAGIDVMSRRGFHFQTQVGRSFMIDQSQGRDAEESVVFTEYQAWNLTFSFGWLFR